MAYNNLPGIIVNTVDGGLVAQRTPVADSILILGTCDQGVINQPYQVTDRAQAALQFGLNGNLIRSMEEAAANSDNVILYRMGAQPMTLAGIGADTTVGAVTPGFTLSFGQSTTTCATDYKIWYSNGVVAVYYLGDLEYSNDPNQTTDNGDITIPAGAVAGNTGLQLGTGASATFAGAITIQAAAALAGTTATPAPTLTAAVTGIGLTGRQTYIAVQEALNLLQGFQVQEIVIPAATLDAPNVAFYVSADTSGPGGTNGTLTNNPATNPNALDWLLTAQDGYGNQYYQWASESVAYSAAGGAPLSEWPAGLTFLSADGTPVALTAGTVTAMSNTITTAAARQTAGYFEVSWGYTIANFCLSVSTLSKTCIGFLATSGPASYRLVDVRKWVGFLPQYNANDNVQAVGRGLLGIPYTVGTNASGLNALCFDFASGYRQPGFFQTENGQYDGTVVQDINQNPVDIGSYIHVFADQAILSNGYATNYVANLATYVAGVCSILDEKTALTNQPMTALKQMPGLVYTPGQLDSLTQAKISVLKYKGSNKSPALLHDFTCSTDASDYTEVLRVRIKGLVISTMLSIGDPFVGASSLDGLQLNSLKTALDNGLVALQQRGYISNPQVTISSTTAQANIGHANLYLTFHPADELVQLNAYVGLTQ